MAAHLAEAALRPLLLPADARLATMEHSALARNNSTEGTEVDTSRRSGKHTGAGAAGAAGDAKPTWDRDAEGRLEATVTGNLRPS